jgi:hypothetical protein
LDFGATRGLTNVDKDGTSWDTNFVPWKFGEDAVASARPAAQSIHLEFWSGDPDYYVNWTYDPKTNLYARADGNKKPYIDRDTNKQIMAKDVVILEMVEDNANDGYDNNVHLLFDDIGSGKAVIFKDGKRTNGTWSKASRTARTIIKDTSGKEVEFNRGLIWMTILPTDGVLTVK